MATMNGHPVPPQDRDDPPRNRWQIKVHPFHMFPSSALALALWGITGFMAQPTLASVMIHLLMVPVLLMLMLWLAHWEGRHHIGEDDGHNSN